MGEIRGAVQGIDVPGVTRMSGATRAPFFAPFLTNDRMLREMAAKTRDNDGFRTLVGLGNQVHIAFVTHALRTGKIGKKNGARFASSLHGDFKELAHLSRRTRGEVFPPVANRITGFHPHFHMTQTAGGRDRTRIIPQQILGAKLAIDAIKHFLELIEGVENELRAAGAIGDGDQGVFAGGIAAVLIFQWTNNDGIKQGVGKNGGAASVLEFGDAGGLPGVGDQHNSATAPCRAATDGLRAEDDGVVHRGAAARLDTAHGVLQAGNVGRKIGKLRDVFGKLEDGKRIAIAHHLANEMGGGLVFKLHFLGGADTGIDHQGEVERTIRFSLEALDFLGVAFL